MTKAIEMERDDKQVSHVVTIDGPGGAGKGTVSQLLADKLGWNLLDSGALYRVLALAAQNNDVSLDDEVGLSRLAIKLDVSFQASKSSLPRVMLDNSDVTDRIRTEDVGNNASKVAAFNGVREALLQRQKAFQVAPGLVADGRDMGTVVFPAAPVKFYLTASADERAQRRYKQLKDKGIGANLADLLVDIQARDKRDMERTVAPLKPAEDAVVIDSSDMTIDEVLTNVLAEIDARL